MKLFILLLVNLIFINKAFSHNTNVVEITIEIGSKRRVTKVAVQGNFSGADTALRESIKRRFSTSKFKGAKRGTYTVRVSYIIDKDGNTADVECVQDPGYGMGAEAVRAVKVLGKWVVPKGGIPVRSTKPTYIPASVRSDE